MSERPSFLTSTFSLCTLISVVGFTGLCVWTKDVASLEKLVTLLAGGYLTKKGVELTQKNGVMPPPPTSNGH